MTDRPVFSRSRHEMLAVVLATAGLAGSLAACSSDEANYRPEPRPASTPSTTARPPAAPTPSTTATTPAPKPAAGQMACGKGGKCG